MDLCGGQRTTSVEWVYSFHPYTGPRDPTQVSSLAKQALLPLRISVLSLFGCSWSFQTKSGSG